MAFSQTPLNIGGNSIETGETSTWDWWHHDILIGFHSVTREHRGTVLHVSIGLSLRSFTLSSYIKFSTIIKIRKITFEFQRQENQSVNETKYLSENGMKRLIWIMLKIQRKVLSQENQLPKVLKLQNRSKKLQKLPLMSRKRSKIRTDRVSHESDCIFERK